MKILSTKILADYVKKLRTEQGFTKEELGKLTGINRIMIGRIEREDFMPSINQIEVLSDILGFEITDLFIESKKDNAFAALRSETYSENEKEGVEQLFKMMLSLRQQKLLRRLCDYEKSGIK
ncbi:helix-turn-helix domain-containing protein [Acidaminobacter hydrogenoformans]|uniref:DNA-binding transcriptional regulator, XRE-family HTH domain n=1 Tax=Acidaminobacter hydrogenoformans DSM 2784 TaxID=1120920 RepID=A0A1G5S6M3_9FIRM|nr:helix-turn-helix transcriptional regulator [Acidaminobacter hydrogenoformans]SCZ81381.1 DNA-binding transcriptional regulator, XRE-family HTH domain [Acidaminobacter hydrogenoformans DSM 2784]